MAGKRELAFAFVLVVVFAGIGVALVELGLRVAELVRGAGRATSYGALLFSTPPWTRGDDGGVRYVPHQAIRALAVYDGIVDYDVRFRTNDLGFIDERDYGGERDPNARHYVFVGDSFTAGYHGGTPWVPRLRELPLRRPFEVYNLGVDATGVQNFALLLSSLAGRVPVSMIDILAIANDFERPLWAPQLADGEISLCPDAPPAAKCTPVAHVIPFDAGADVIDAAARESSARRATVPAPPHGLRVTALIRNALLRLGFMHRESPQIAFGFAALARIRRDFPNVPIRLIQLPQREEAVSRRFETDLRERVEAAGILYASALEGCHWSADMFLEHDGHPNDKGYRNIASCVVRLSPEMSAE